MGKILYLPVVRTAPLASIHALKQLSDAIDALIIDAIAREEMDALEIVGIIAHRVGTLLHGLEDKERLWLVAEAVLRRQAEFE